VSQKKNDTDVAHYNFNANQLILVIFGNWSGLLAELKRPLLKPTVLCKQLKWRPRPLLSSNQSISSVCLKQQMTN